MLKTFSHALTNEHTFIFCLSGQMEKIVVNLGCNLELVYWSVLSSNKREEDGVNEVEGGGGVILAQSVFHFIREHDKLV